MAQKKESRTQEMQLAAAKIPAEAWPYALPEGWTWVRLGKIFEVNPKNKADDATMASFITMADIAAGMVSEFQTTEKMWGEIRKGHTQFADGDVAFAKISPCFENRKSMIVRGLKNGIGAGTTELIVLRSPFFDPRFVFYLISTEDFIHRGVATYRGVVGQQRINMNFVKEYPVPLPPMDEQKRIVRRIESLFSKLDVVAEKIDAADAAFVAQKNALLHAAFDGTLTGEWRNKNSEGAEKTMVDKIPVNWEWKLLGKVARWGSGGTPARKNPEYYHGNILWIKSGELKEKYIFDTEEKITQKAVEESSAKIFPEYTVMIAMYGATIGQVAIMGKEATTNQAVACAVCSEKLSHEYLYYFLISQKERFEQLGRGGAQPNISQMILKKYQIPLPPLPEQHEIVRRLDALLGRLARARAAVGEARAQIASLRTSILARAFRGEL